MMGHGFFLDKLRKNVELNMEMGTIFWNTKMEMGTIFWNTKMEMGTIFWDRGSNTCINYREKRKMGTIF